MYVTNNIAFNLDIYSLRPWLIRAKDTENEANDWLLTEPTLKLSSQEKWVRGIYIYTYYIVYLMSYSD